MVSEITEEDFVLSPRTIKDSGQRAINYNTACSPLERTVSYLRARTWTRERGLQFIILQSTKDFLVFESSEDKLVLRMTMDSVPRTTYCNTAIIK